MASKPIAFYTVLFFFFFGAVRVSFFETQSVFYLVLAKSSSFSQCSLMAALIQPAISQFLTSANLEQWRNTSTQTVTDMRKHG
jgi:hypothetical protein